MADTLNITLAKALKLKNRLAGKLAKLMQTVQLYNSTQQTAEQIDVRAAFTERAELVRQLTELKVTIARTNAPIQRDIFDLAELKAEVTLLTGLNTKHGTFLEGYPNAGQVSYVAQFRKTEVDAMIDALETRIDTLQDKLDTFNAQALVAVDAQTVAAGDTK
jgi:hypothetical protein